MNYSFDLIALATSCIALYFIVRAKKTYFLDSRFFIGIATVGFVAYVGEATYSDIQNVPVSVGIDTVLIGIMAVSIGIASYLLKRSERRGQSGDSQVRQFIKRPPLPFTVFLLTTLGWTVSGLIFQPWALNQNSPGSVDYYFTYPPWYVGVSVSLLASFIGLPVLSFFRMSRTVGDRSASISMKIISGCWAMFGVSFFFQVVGGEFLPPMTQGLGFVADGFLFILMSFALREPTVLARIVTSGEEVNQVVSSLTVDSIVLYNTESDRRKLIETFAKDSLTKRVPVVCRVARSEVPLYLAVLKSLEIGESRSAERNITVQPLEGSPTLSNSGIESSVTTSDMRELIDLDEFDLDHAKDIVGKITIEDKSRPRRSSRIWALNIDGSQAGIVDLLTSTNPNSRVIDLARQQDVFSSLLGLKHEDVLGQRILLEYDPSSNYEDIIQEFVREFQTNVESVAIFANAGSPVYREFNEQRNLRLFCFSTRTSTPSRLTNEQVLLPERDTSLLLDAVDKLLQANRGRHIGIVFEVFTYLILSLGFEKAYGVVSSVVEMAESELATVLVLVNFEALDPRTMSGLRGLFQSQLFYNSSGLKQVRVGRREDGKTTSRDTSPGLQEVNRSIQI